MKPRLLSFPLPATTRALSRLLTHSGCLWTALAVLAALTFATQPAQAAVIEAWVHRYNGPADSNDFANAVAIDRSGNVVVTGSSNNGTNDDYYTAKYAAADGTLVWEKRYNGPANSSDVAIAIAVDGDGNVVVTGYSNTRRFPSGYLTLKYAASNGALIWAKSYFGREDSFATAVAIDTTGNVIVTGTSEGAQYNDDYYTAKYAATEGALLWEKRYNGPANDDDGAQAVALDKNNNVVVTGYSRDVEGAGNYYTAK